MTGKPSTVVARTLDCPHTPTTSFLSRELERLTVATRRGRDRPLRHNRTSRGDHNREHMLVPVRVDTNDVIHLICKHHY